MKNIELHKVASRLKLPPRRDPYWQRLESGQYIGFRKMTATSTGSWSVRYRDEATGKQSSQALGDFDHLAPSERFDEAKKSAMQWLAHLSHGGSTDVLTVAEACRTYAQLVESKSGKTKADEIRARYRRWVDNDAIGGIELLKLKRDHVRAWRERLENSLIVTSSGETRRRSNSSNNRDMTALRAALNHALSERQVSSDFAWNTPLKPVENADGRRTLYLTLDQRRELIAHARPDAAIFLQGLCALPLRPGALAALTVANFDRVHGTLHVSSDKAGAGRSIKLPAAVVTLLTECARSKLPSAPLFSRADGKAWDKDSWKLPIKDAVLAGQLPHGTTAYTLRHSTITDLVVNGLDLASVATIAGTSVMMIAKYYAHLQQDRAANALAGLSP